MTTMAKRKNPTVTPWEKSLRKLRASLGDISQAEAARRCGVATRTWISWENSQNIPSPISAHLIRLTFPGHDFPKKP